MPTESDSPDLQRYRVILREILEPGMSDRSALPLYKLLQMLHASGCLCEPLCLENPTCTCPDDAHLDTECYKLRETLCGDLERYLKGINGDPNAS